MIRAAAFVLLLAALVPAADPPKPDAAPADASAVVSVNAKKLWGHAAFAPAREARGKAEFAWVVQGLIGFAPADLADLTVFWTADGAGPFVLATTQKPHDAAKVLADLAPKGEAKATAGVFSVPGTEFPLARRIDDRTLLFAPKSVEAAAFAKVAPRRETGGPALLVRLNGKSLASLLGSAAKELPATSAVFTADPEKDGKAKAELALTFATPADAKKAAPALEAALKELGVWSASQMKKSAEVPFEHGTPVPLLEWIGSTAKATKVRADGPAVIAVADIDFAEAVSRVIAALPDSALAGAGAAPGENNLKQIVLGSINYADTNAGKCPANSYDKDGKPLLSWRVHILPYIEQQALYNKFKLDEPWDSPHNKPLANEVVRTYTIPGRAAPLGETYFRCFIGPKNVKGEYRPWLTDDPAYTVRYPASIPDGTSNTIMVVEAGESVPWTKPDDLPFDGVMPVPPLGGPSGRFLAGFCDGTARVMVRRKLGEANLKAMVTLAGGEVINFP